jgi:hypothetical protein
VGYDAAMRTMFVLYAGTIVAGIAFFTIVGLAQH